MEKGGEKKKGRKERKKERKKKKRRTNRLAFLLSSLLDTEAFFKADLFPDLSTLPPLTFPFDLPLKGLLDCLSPILSSLSLESLLSFLSSLAGVGKTNRFFSRRFCFPKRYEKRNKKEQHFCVILRRRSRKGDKYLLLLRIILGSFY